MQKRYLNELTREELEMVLEKNKGLQNMIRELTRNSEEFFIEEQLSYLKDSIGDYAIDPYQYSYISIEKPLDFIYDMRELERCVPVLSDKDRHYLEDPLEMAKELWGKGNYSKELELKFNNAVASLRDVVLGNMISQLEYGEDMEAITNYFFEVFLPYEDEELYVEGNCYILKEDITINYESNNPNQ